RSSILLAGIFLVVVPPIIWLTYRVQREFSILTRRSQDLNGEISTTVEQSVQGIRVLKAFGRSKQALEKFQITAVDLRDHEVLKAKIGRASCRERVKCQEVTVGIKIYR